MAFGLLRSHFKEVLVPTQDQFSKPHLAESWHRHTEEIDSSVDEYYYARCYPDRFKELGQESGCRPVGTEVLKRK